MIDGIDLALGRDQSLQAFGVVPLYGWGRGLRRGDGESECSDVNDISHFHVSLRYRHDRRICPALKGQGIN